MNALAYFVAKGYDVPTAQKLKLYTDAIATGKARKKFLTLFGGTQSNFYPEYINPALNDDGDLVASGYYSGKILFSYNHIYSGFAPGTTNIVLPSPISDNGWLSQEKDIADFFMPTYQFGTKVFDDNYDHINISLNFTINANINPLQQQFNLAYYGSDIDGANAYFLSVIPNEYHECFYSFWCPEPVYASSGKGTQQYVAYYKDRFIPLLDPYKFNNRAFIYFLKNNITTTVSTFHDSSNEFIEAVVTFISVAAVLAAIVTGAQLVSSFITYGFLATLEATGASMLGSSAGSVYGAAAEAGGAALGDITLQAVGMAKTVATTNTLYQYTQKYSY